MTKTAAREIYRQAWNSFLLSKTPKERTLFEEVMDSVAKECTDEGGPGLEWQEFVDTLPGYVQYWEGVIDELEVLIQKLEDEDE